MNFFNNPNTLITMGNGLPPGAYYFALLIAPAGATDPAMFTFSGAYATNQMAAGRISGGGNVVIPNWPAGTARSFMVCGWPSSFGHDWNPIWLSGFYGVGMSMIATGVAGGFDPNSGGTIPNLNIFGGNSITTGFMVPSCLGPYWRGFTLQPTSQTVVLGTTVQFTVAASACPAPLCQWYHNGAPIPGAASLIYQIPSASMDHAGTYYAVLSSAAWGSYTSASATLTVLTAPIITSQPQSQTNVVGATVALQVSAAGVLPLSYQWFFDFDIIPNASAPSLVLTNVQVSSSGTYSVVVTNMYGAVTSSPALLTVLASPPTLTLSPWDRTAAVGRFADFVVKAAGALPLSYQWFFEQSAIPGATGTDLHLAELQLSQTGNYYVAVTNAFGAVTSPPARLTVFTPSNNPVGTVVAWGATNWVPEPLTNVTAIAAGGDHDLALRADGTVVAWGQNTQGQAAVPPGLDNVVAIAAGDRHNVALRADGTVVSWGSSFDQVTNVPNGLSNVIAVAAADTRSMALKSDGSIVAWGNNSLGQSVVPVDLDGVVAIAAGAYHALALRFDGTVVTWGAISGRVTQGLSNVISIAAGADNSLALKADATVVAWGGDLYGQSTVPPGLDQVQAISAGGPGLSLAYIVDSHSLALRSDGTVTAWGNNSKGQTAIPADLENVLAVSAGAYHSLALVAPPPPVQVVPVSQTAESGATATLVARIRNFVPLSYQWFFNATNLLPGETNRSLCLTNVQTARAGLYSVAITSVNVGVTSAPAVISVIAPVTRTVVPGVLLRGQTGAAMLIEHRENLSNQTSWAPLETVLLTNSPQWYFDLAANGPTRLYRVAQPGVAVNPFVQLHPIPAIVLAGNIGSSVRLDRINQFGPTDAWVPLTTITLTNSSQLYFDTSVVGQPRRLYRIVPVP